MNEADLLEAVVETIDVRGHAQGSIPELDGKVCLYGALAVLDLQGRLDLSSDVGFAAATLRSAMPANTTVSQYNDAHKWKKIRVRLLKKSKELRNSEVLAK